MNFPRIAFAAIGGFVAYFAFGFVAFTAGPLVAEYQKFPTLFRSQEQMKSVMPFGMLAMLVAMFILATIYSLCYKGGPGLVEGLRFGVLIGAFCVCSFVIHNYVNLNIGLRLTVAQAIAYFIEWTIVGIVMGLIYKPSTG